LIQAHLLFLHWIAKNTYSFQGGCLTSLEWEGEHQTSLYVCSYPHIQPFWRRQKRFLWNIG
jgi:hypothetical protein